MKCKYTEVNAKERKCNDYYYSHGTKKHGIYCRLKEWKEKKGICPYDHSIQSKNTSKIKLKAKGQEVLPI
jgi:hypothetical protein